jgi:hypothetical protein
LVLWLVCRSKIRRFFLLRPLLSFFFWGIYTRCGISFSKLSAFAIFLRYRV